MAGWLNGVTSSVVPTGITCTTTITCSAARIAGNEASAQVWHFSTALSGDGQPSSAAADSITTSTALPPAALQTWNVVTSATAKAQNSRNARSSERFAPDASDGLIDTAQRYGSRRRYTITLLELRSLACSCRLKR
jgi:hypothetical protein